MKKHVAWAGAILSLAAIGVLLWRVRLRDLGTAIASADPKWLVASFAVFFLMFFVRAWRWSILLGGTPIGITWHANVIGYMFNILLPLRLGEIARVWLIAKKSDTPMASAVSAALAERLLDLGAVLALFAGLAQLVPMRDSFTRPALIGSIALGLALAGTAVLVVKGEAFEPFLAKRLGARAEMVLARFREIRSAFRDIGTPGHVLRIGGLTVVAWFLTILSAELAMRSFLPGQSGMLRAALVVVTANLGGALPSAPGGLGIVQGFAASALVVPFGVDEGRALAFVLVFTLGQQLSLVLLGVISMARIGMSFGEIREGVRTKT